METATVTTCKNCRDGIIKTEAAEAAGAWLHLDSAEAACHVGSTRTDSVATPWDVAR